MSNVAFFYDSQIRRYMLQFIRLFSNFQVQFGKDRDGNTALQRVPVKYGDSSRQAATILRNNSESMLNTVPMISCYISGLTYEQARMQNPYHVSNVNVRERSFNEGTQEYDTTQGTAFTVERLMPVPYKLTMKADIWTSNTEQKLQLIEQIGCLFNPSLEIQSTDNYVDWTSLSIVTLTDVSWSSRTVPVGADDAIDVAALTFEIPIWISAPAKIKKLGVIQNVISDILDPYGNLADGAVDEWLMLGNRKYVTPLMYGVLLNGNQLTLLKYQDTVNANMLKNGTRDNWHTFVNLYGTLTNGISQIRLLQSDGETEVVGTVSYHPSDDTVLLFNVDIDTKPVDTLTAVNAIVNPLTSGPGAGLAVHANGQRYILTEDTGFIGNVDGPDAWKGSGGQQLVAKANDIVQYTSGQWQVVFEATEVTDIGYVTNLATNQQYKWTGSRWMRSYEGDYKNGKWSIVL